MEHILRGVKYFHDHVFPTKRKLFESLARNQKPHALFIACSDSRVHPNLITHTEPGELFILRNPGNIIPAYQANNGSEAATIEYATEVLKISNIIVCGHSNCGAITALLRKADVRNLPAVTDWLHHAESTRRIIETAHSELPFEQRVEMAICKNVLVQVNNLKTHPAVAASLAAGTLSIHAWVYDIATGDVRAHDTADDQFHSIVADPCEVPS